MVQNNKVLTVSYGTFSCTLEGFEDSFGTMKAIAEYFRDLASDDRYFGAEPPQPDADMLARIAQREIARQVEARTSKEGIHLRAATPATPPAAAPTPVAEPAPRELAVTEPGEVDFFVDPALAQHQTEAAPAGADTSAEPVDAYSIEGSEEEPFADDFEDHFEDSAVAEAAVAPEAPAAGQLVETPPGEVDFFVAPEEAKEIAETADTPAEAAYSIAGSTEEPFADELEDEVFAEDVVTARADAADATDTLVETPPGEVDFFIAPEEAKEIAETAEAPAEATYSFEGSTEEPFADELEDEVFAEDVVTARADAAGATDTLVETPPGEVDFFVAPEEAKEIAETAEAAYEDATDDQNDAVAETVDLDQIAAVVAASASAEAADDVQEIEAEEVAKPEPAKPAPNSIAAKLQRIRAVVSRTPAEEFSEDQHAEAVTKKAADAIAEIAEDINATVNAEEDEADAAPDAAEQDNDTLITRALEELQSTPKPGKVDATDEPEAEDAAAQPRRARIIRVRRGITKPTETVAEAAAAPAGPASTLSEADENDLRRELAEVEAELLAATRADAEAKDAAMAEEEDAAEQPQAEAPVSRSAKSKDAPDSDVSRLMAAADEKLGDPNTASSRETYSHMRAAVAAAQGDPEASAEDAEKDYREDLASVVHPRRPVVRRKAARPEPSENRPSPLKLVAEQRVAEAPAVEAAPSAPVSPRRVRTEAKPTSAEAFNSDTGFAKYVQETGAVELQELLEAAASYLSFVKGQDVFSRPELINKVRATGTEFNREDSMRSFGQLLRDGKIARKNNGRFAASDQIGFQPQDRAAG